MPPRPHRRHAGFTLIEAMIAMLVMGFGLLAIAGFQTTLSHNSDVAKQRTEATRLAQAKMEDLRSFQRSFPAAASAPVVVAWADIASGVDAPSTTTNTVFDRIWDVETDVASRQKTLRVRVNWTDRQGIAQNVTLASLIANADPMDAGALAAPPTSAEAKKPVWSMPPIPSVGKYLGGGRSAIQLPGGTQYIVFNAVTGAVIGKCSGTVDASLTAATICSTAFAARLVTGFISGLTPVTTFDTVAQAAATSLALVAAPPATAPPHECFVARVPIDGNHPRDPGSSPPTGFASGFYSYFCLVEPLPDGSWSGSLQVIKLAGSAMQTGDRICRLAWDQGDSGTLIGDSSAEHPDPYVDVRESLQAQNFRYVPRLGPGTPGNCPPPATLNGIAVTYSSVNLIP